MTQDFRQKRRVESHISPRCGKKNTGKVLFWELTAHRTAELGLLESSIGICCWILTWPPSKKKCAVKKLYLHLGASFKHVFIFTPTYLAKWSNFITAIFVKLGGLEPPPFLQIPPAVNDFYPPNLILATNQAMRAALRFSFAHLERSFFCFKKKTPLRNGNFTLEKKKTCHIFQGVATFFWGEMKETNICSSWRVPVFLVKTSGVTKSNSETLYLKITQRPR